jgi:hypothetical protein
MMYRSICRLWIDIQLQELFDATRQNVPCMVVFPLTLEVMSPDDARAIGRPPFRELFVCSSDLRSLTEPIGSGHELVRSPQPVPCTEMQLVLGISCELGKLEFCRYGGRCLTEHFTHS